MRSERLFKHLNELEKTLDDIDRWDVTSLKSFQAIREEISAYYREEFAASIDAALKARVAEGFATRVS